jgi:hypothetical protein
MYAVIGKVRLKAGREQKALAMIGERGVLLALSSRFASGWWLAA